MSIKISPVSEAKAIEMYLFGNGSSTIAKSLGIGVTTVKRIMLKHKINRSRNQASDILRRVCRKQVLKDYESGMSMADCASKHNCSEGVISRILKTNKIKPRKTNQGGKFSPWFGRLHTDKTKEKLRDLMKERMSKKIISEPYREQYRAKAIHPTLNITEPFWHKMLLKNANYTCSISGEKGVKLEVHHLYNVKDFPEKRWDKDYVIVVKKTIHRQFHDIFMGWSGNTVTPENWKKFLNWKCSACGAQHDRDVNAACNVLSAGAGIALERMVV